MLNIQNTKQVAAEPLSERGERKG